jgi:hypothetical protein
VNEISRQEKLTHRPNGSAAVALTKAFRLRPMFPPGLTQRVRRKRLRLALLRPVEEGDKRPD